MLAHLGARILARPKIFGVRRESTPYVLTKLGQKFKKIWFLVKFSFFSKTLEEGVGGVGGGWQVAPTSYGCFGSEEVLKWSFYLCSMWMFPYLH